MWLVCVSFLCHIGYFFNISSLFCLISCCNGCNCWLALNFIVVTLHPICKSVAQGKLKPCEPSRLLPILQSYGSELMGGGFGIAISGNPIHADPMHHRSPSASHTPAEMAHNWSLTNTVFMWQINPCIWQASILFCYSIAGVGNPWHTYHSWHAEGSPLARWRWCTALFLHIRGKFSSLLWF